MGKMAVDFVEPGRLSWAMKQVDEVGAAEGYRAVLNSELELHSLPALFQPLPNGTLVLTVKVPIAR
jgi:hypothetical protein